MAKVSFTKSDGGTQRCSATLISCRELLTAQHCFQPGQVSMAVTLRKYRPTQRDQVFEPIPITFGTTVFQRLPGQTLPLIGGPDTDFPWGQDLAIIRLPSIVRGIAVARVLRPPEHIDIAELASIAGWGRTGPSASVQSEDRRFSTLLPAGLSVHDEGFVEWGRTGSEGATELGDSGGPLFFGNAPDAALGAVASTQMLPLGGHARYTLADVTFIDGVVGSPVDGDGDGTPDECDNCPVLANVTQADLDGDGKGDACDLDRDGDGDFDDSDNCPDIANATQDNCNRDAEIQLGTDELGDACDPNPCSAARATKQRLTSDLGGWGCLNIPVAEGPCDIGASTGIEWRGVVAGENEGKAGTTMFAHCACERPHATAEERVNNCQRTTTDAPRCLLAEATAFPEPGAATLSQWQAISTTSLPAGSGGREPVVEESPSLAPPQGTRLLHLPTLNHRPSGSPVQKVSWLFASDLSSFGIPSPPLPVTATEQLAATAAALDGLGWAFTSTFEAPRDCLGCPARPATPDLSNGYFRQDLQVRNFVVVPPPPPELYIYPWLLDIGCPHCGGGDWLAAWSDPSQPMLRVEDRLVSVVQPVLGAGVAELIRAPGASSRYLAAGEPLALLERRGNPLRGVFVDPAGIGPTQVLVEAPEGGIFMQQASASSLAITGPSASTFNALSAEVYVARVAGGAVEFARYNVFEGGPTITTLALPSGALPQALAYRFLDDSLYLAFTRVVSGAVRLGVHRFPRLQGTGPSYLTELTDLGGASRFFLNATYDGALSLAASGAETQSTLYLLLDPKVDRLEVRSSYLDPRPGALVRAPNTLLQDRFPVALRRGSPTATISFDDVFPGDFVAQSVPLGGSLSALAAVAACGDSNGLAQSSWPMRGGCPSRQGRSTMPGAATNALRWSLTTTSDLKTGAAIGADGTVYQPAGSKLLAVSPGGVLGWSFTALATIRSTPAVGRSGLVYFGDDSGRVHAVDAAGAERWHVDTGGAVQSSPAITGGGLVLVGSNNDQLWALDAASGETRWRASTYGNVASSPAVAPDGRAACVGSDDWHLHCFSTATGSRIWKALLNGWVRSSPAFGADGTIYVGTTTNSLYALRPDGTLKWIFWAFGPVLSSPALGPDGTIYVGSEDGRVYAVGDKGLFGQLLWSYWTGGPVRGGPLVGSDGTVFAASLGRKAYALRPGAAASRVLWSRDLGSALEASPAIAADGTLYFPTTGRKLFAIGP